MTYGDRTRGATTKADGAYLELRNQILLGTLEPGSRVDYVQLSASLGVSITPLREALRRLEADHLVIRNAHRDVVIAPLTRAEAAELVAVRQELDLLAARLAAAQMTRDELARARELVARQDEQEALRYLRDAGLPVAVGGLLSVNRAFHRMVYCGSHNQVLIQYRDAISTRTERYVIMARQISTVPAGGLPAAARAAADGAGGPRRGCRHGTHARPLPGTRPRLRRRDLRRRSGAPG